MSRARRFFEFLGRHHKILILSIAVVIGVHYARVFHADLEGVKQQRLAEGAQFHTIGNAGVATSQQVSDAQLVHLLGSSFNAEITANMAAQGNKPARLTQATAEVKSTTLDIGKQRDVFQPSERGEWTGALTGYTIEESRKGPPLSSIKLFYDPKESNPNKAFTGSKWVAYDELFKVSIGDWTRGKDGKFVTTLALTRTVSKPAPDDPSKLIEVGTEQIPITGMTTVAAPGSPLTPNFHVPRWTLDLGLAKSPKFGYSGHGQIDFRMTDRYGIYAGTANRAVLGGISIRLDAHH